MCLYSVIVPTYAGADKLPVVLYSLARQTIRCDAFEVIIIDDGSPAQESRAIATTSEMFSEMLRIQVVHCERNGGPAAARNAGIRAAHGKYIFFTDDDCEVPATWMETHLRLYCERPDVSFIAGWYFPTEYELAKSPYAQFWFFYYLTGFGMNLKHQIGTTDQIQVLLVQNTANLSIRRSTLSIVKGFDEEFVTPGGEDTDFGKRLKEAGFRGLFIPLHVRHTSALTFRRFLRVMRNRGIANYMLCRKATWKTYGTQQYRYMFRIYRQHVENATLTFRGVRKNRRRLWFLGFLFYTTVFSPIGMSVSRMRWKRIQKRQHAY
jgi:glycosyltransferase involved in cell wall biosynthesis